MILDTREAHLTSQQKPHDKDVEPPPYSSPPLSSIRYKQKDSTQPLPPLPSEAGNSGCLKPALPPRPSLVPRPSVDQVHIHERTSPISGTFHIDPKIPSLKLFDAKGNKQLKINPPHASFRSRRGAINLDLGTTGDSTPSASKANVHVSTRNGNISLRLLPISHLCPRLGLDVYSRSGDIILFVPENFVGAIQVSSNRGSIEFLPALASTLKVLKESKKEALVMIGDQSSAVTRDLNFCQLNSRSGKLIIGLSDVDSYAVKPGFWGRIAHALGSKHQE